MASRSSRDADLESALQDAGVDQQTAAAVLDGYGDARLDGLRTALALLALFTVVALFFTRRVPEKQPGGVTMAASPAPPGHSEVATRADARNPCIPRTHGRDPCHGYPGHR